MLIEKRKFGFGSKTGFISLTTGFQFVIVYFAYRKLYNDDKKCLVSIGGRKEGEFVAVNSHDQFTHGIIVGQVSSKTDALPNTCTPWVAFSVLGFRSFIKSWLKGNIGYGFDREMQEIEF